jgi:integrase
LWLARCAQKSRNGFSASSRNAHVQILKEVFALALRDKMILESPAAHLKYIKREKPIRLTPTWEQFKAIVENVREQVFNADAQDSADFLEFLGLAGLGQAEASSLSRADIDLDAGRIITFRHKTSIGFAIPIFPQLCPLLERRCEGKASHEKIFSIADAKHALANACKRLGFPAFNQRSLRRMFITRAIEKGVDVKVISEWQGHKDGGKLILDTYSHVAPAHSRRMAQLMSDAEPGNVLPIGATEAA